MLDQPRSHYLNDDGSILDIDCSILSDAIRRFGTVKDVAQVLGCALITARRYREGKTFPDARDLARLMRASREITHAMLRMAGLDELSLDLEEARLRDELARLMLTRARNGDGRVEAALAALSCRMVDHDR